MLSTLMTDSDDIIGYLGLEQQGKLQQESQAATKHT